MPKYYHLPDPKDRPKVVLLEDYEYERGVVPRGFLADGSTQLRLLWGLIQIGLGSFGEHDPAWLVHDWEYAHDGKMPNGLVLTRKQVDDLFKQRLEKAGVHPERVKRAYKNVRRFGFIPWVKGDGKPDIMTEEQLKELGL